MTEVGISSRRLACAAAAIFLLARPSAHAARVPQPEHGVCTWTPYGSSYPLGERQTCSKPVNVLNLTQRADWAPWSHKPYCPGARNASNPAEQFCVYTSATFRGHHGISLVTSPELSSIIGDTLDDSVVPPALRDHISSPLMSDITPPGDLPYVVKDLPGRGKGVVATRNISRWEIVMVSFPAIMAPMEFLDTDNLRDKDKVNLLARVVRRLPQHEQKTIFSLARSVGGALVEDILRTNIFGVEVNGIQYMALFPGGSVCDI
jgi:hypothetical protein